MSVPWAVDLERLYWTAKPLQTITPLFRSLYLGLKQSPLKYHCNVIQPTTSLNGPFNDGSVVGQFREVLLESKTSSTNDRHRSTSPLYRPLYVRPKQSPIQYHYNDILAP